MRSLHPNPFRWLAAFAVAALLGVACSAAAEEPTASSASTDGSSTSISPAGVTSPASPASPGQQPSKLQQARDHLKHLVFIVQENRSFDHYFGTFPGAEGFPMRNGRIDVCIPDPLAGHCVRPYHSTSQLQQGGPHDEAASQGDVNG